MKNLKDFLLESLSINESTVIKKIVFDFTDLEGGEEILKSLEGMDHIEIDGKKVTVTVDETSAGQLDTFQDIVQQFSNTIRSSQKRSSNEQYAQKTQKFENAVYELGDAIDEIKNPKQDSNEDNKDKDDKEDE